MIRFTAKYLPEMGLSLREVPSGEIYLNDPRNTKPEDLLDPDLCGDRIIRAREVSEVNK